MTNLNGLTLAATIPVAGLSTDVTLDSIVQGSDITTNNVSSTKHGLCPKLPADATKYLDGTGAYTVPAGGGGGIPAFHGCKVYSNATQSIPATTDTAVTFNAEEFDTDAYHDPATNNTRITIPTGLGGKYEFTFSTFYASAPNSLHVTLRPNGSGDTRPTQGFINAAGGAYGSAMVWVTSLVQGDYVEVVVFENAGTVVIGHASSSGAQSVVTCSLVGT